MGLSKAIDETKNKCYQKFREEISTFIAQPTGGVDKERLSKALNQILSEKDIADYFRSRENSSTPKRKLP